MTANTDTTSAVTDNITITTDPYLAPFQTGIRAGTTFVMISTAINPKVDPGPAAFSSTVIGSLLGRQLGFTGVVISDDVGSAAQVQAWSPLDRAPMFLGASPHRSGPARPRRSIYPAEAAGRAPQRRAGGSAFPGFFVDSLDTTAATLTEISAPVLGEHERMPWGCRMVFEDPEGRPVEINQRGHCSCAPSTRSLTANGSDRGQGRF